MRMFWRNEVEGKVLDGCKKRIWRGVARKTYRKTMGSIRRINRIKSSGGDEYCKDEGWRQESFGEMRGWKLWRGELWIWEGLLRRGATRKTYRKFLKSIRTKVRKESSGGDENYKEDGWRWECSGEMKWKGKFWLGVKKNLKRCSKKNI